MGVPGKGCMSGVAPGLAVHPGMLWAGSSILPSRPRRGRDALTHGTGRTGCTGMGGQVPGRGSCVSFSQAHT